MNRQVPIYLAIAAALVVFIGTALLVHAGRTTAVDRAVLLSFRSGDDAARGLGPAWLPETVRDITALGSTSVLATVLILCAGSVLLLRRWRDLGLLLSSLVGAELFSLLLKHLFGRARPALVANAPQVFTSSFPSSHAMVSLVTLLTVAAIVMRAGAPRRLVVYAYAAASTIAIAIGLSRLYLGVHWPSDVIGGWSAGLAWFLTILAIAGPTGRRRETTALRRSYLDRIVRRQ